MDNSCRICQHPRLPDIDVDIVEEMPVAKIAWKYHLPATHILVHREHGPYTAREWQALRQKTTREEPRPQVLPDESFPIGWPQAQETPLRQFRRNITAAEEAYTQAKEDTWAQGRMREDLREMLTRLFAEDEMGLS